MNDKNKQPCGTFTKKIKSTIYEVNVHFSTTSHETIADKIARLLKREVARC